jgi:hypothetical protein
MASPLDKKTGVGLKTRHVFLDTEVYRRYGYNLNDKVLQTLLKQIKDRVCTMHITDITLSEIRRQIGDMAAEVAQLVNKGNKELRRWEEAVRSWKTTPAEARKDVDAAALTKDRLLHFETAISSGWSSVKHEALGIAPKDIFDDDLDMLADGVVVCRIMKADAAPIGSPWLWTLAFGQHEDRTPTHGYEPTRRPRWWHSRPGRQAEDAWDHLGRSKTVYYERADRSAAFYRAATSLVQKLHSELIDERTL